MYRYRYICTGTTSIYLQFDILRSEQNIIFNSAPDYEAVIDCREEVN